MDEEDIGLCVDWMRAFWEVLQEEFPEQRRSRSLPPGPNKGSVLNDEHNLLTHSITLEMLVSLK